MNCPVQLELRIQNIFKELYRLPDLILTSRVMTWSGIGFTSILQAKKLRTEEV